METPDQRPPRRERPKPVTPDRCRGRAHPARSWPSADGKYLGVRVGVTNGGCAGMSYTMDYAERPSPLDEVVEDKGVKIFIDPKAILFLIGTEMDFVTRKARRALCVQQSEPDGGLRLRRNRLDHAGV